MPLPPPRCDCGHEYSIHPGGWMCKRVINVDKDGNKELCECGKFRVPQGPGKPKKTTAGRSSSRKNAPWWR